MKNISVFKKSHLLTAISSSVKIDVRKVGDILKAVINPEGTPHPWQHFEYLKAGTVPTVCDYSDFSEYLAKWSRLDLEALRNLFSHDREMTSLLDVATDRAPTGYYGDLVNAWELTTEEEREQFLNTACAGYFELND